MENVSVNDFTVEKQCEYKGRVYLIRDNGAVMRLPKEGRKWTRGDAMDDYC